MATWVLTFCFIDGATRPLSKKINHLLISCVFADLRGFWHFCHPISSKIQQKIPKSSKIPKKISKSPKNQTKILKSSNIQQKSHKRIPKSNKNPTKNPKSSKNPTKNLQILKNPTKKTWQDNPPSSSGAPDCDRVEVQYEQQSYDKMPGFWLRYLWVTWMSQEVRFNGW